MSREKTLVVIREDGAFIGRCVHYPKGWLFIPHNAAHRPGRRYRPDANSCVPSWAKKMTYAILTPDEWRHMTTRVPI
jgi:hypothetical protein